jgi:hypothetical protein
MICKDTLMMIAGGLLAGYGASKAMGGKKDFTKLEVLGPLVGGGALLGLGYMNYIKKKTPMPSIPPNVKGIPADNTPLFGDEGNDIYSISPSGLKQSAVPTVLSPTKPRNVWANYTESNTLNTSGNASSLYDYNHIYPGFI